MELPNRQQRRKWAKEMGLLKQKKNAPLKEQQEMSRRTAEAGKQIHFRNTERNLEREDKLKQSKEQKENQQLASKLIDEGASMEEVDRTILKGTLTEVDLKTKNRP